MKLNTCLSNKQFQFAVECVENIAVYCLCSDLLVLFPPM